MSENFKIACLCLSLKDQKNYTKAQVCWDGGYPDYSRSNVKCFIELFHAIAK